MKTKVWLVRNRNGALMLFTKSKPHKDEDRGVWVNDTICIGVISEAIVIYFGITTGLDPKWEDTEPLEVRIRIERIMEK